VVFFVLLKSMPVISQFCGCYLGLEVSKKNLIFDDRFQIYTPCILIEKNPALNVDFTPFI